MKNKIKIYTRNDTRLLPRGEVLLEVFPNKHIAALSIKFQEYDFKGYDLNVRQLRGAVVNFLVRRGYILNKQYEKNEVEK